MSLRQITALPTNLSYKGMHSNLARGDMVKQEASSVRDLERALIKIPALPLTVMEGQIRKCLASCPSSVQ